MEANEAGSPNGNESHEELLYFPDRETLETQRKQEEEAGNFLDAEQTYIRILKLKQKIKLEQRKSLGEKQDLESGGLDGRFNEEFAIFNETWDVKIEEFRQECLNGEEERKQKQKEEFETTQRSLEENTPVIPKHSSEFLNLKKIQDTLVRNKEYREAHAVQEKMKLLEEGERANWGQERASKIAMNLSSLAKRQENEVFSYKQRCLGELEEMKKQRAVEMEQFIKKYQNIKKELEVSHKVEVNKFEGKHTTGSGIYKTDASIANKLINSPSRFSRTEDANEVEDQ